VVGKKEIFTMLFWLMKNGKKMWEPLILWMLSNMYGKTDGNLPVMYTFIKEFIHQI
jgi:hypothetical protein